MPRLAPTVRCSQSRKTHSSRGARLLGDVVNSMDANEIVFVCRYDKYLKDIFSLLRVCCQRPTNMIGRPICSIPTSSPTRSGMRPGCATPEAAILGLATGTSSSSLAPCMQKKSVLKRDALNFIIASADPLWPRLCHRVRHWHIASKIPQPPPCRPSLAHAWLTGLADEPTVGISAHT